MHRTFGNSDDELIPVDADGWPIGAVTSPKNENTPGQRPSDLLRIHEKSLGGHLPEGKNKLTVSTSWIPWSVLLELTIEPEVESQVSDVIPNIRYQAQEILAQHGFTRWVRFSLRSTH